jgi:CDP-diacylglycerol--serine O-phosphatidyltransferase
MRKIKELVPNTLTSANLFSGCIGIVFVFNNQLEYAAIMIWIAGVFDFFDGFSARILGVSSEIGKQLDSLADMVTFGVLPSMIVYQMIVQYQQTSSIDFEYLPYTAFIITVFSAVRLAIFNIDTKQSETFIGLPTPANAICISAFPFMTSSFGLLTKDQLIIALILYIILFSWLMISNMKMLALKFKSFGWAENQARWIFILTSIILLATLQITAIPLIILVYILTSVANNVLSSQS